jgi:hypothetical protein
MHPYLHEYYSVARFKAAYATPIAPLTDQSQWPEVEIDFSLCPPLTKRKTGRPKQSRYKAWFEKGGSGKKGKKDGKNDEKKDEKPKRSQKGNKNGCKFCQTLGHRGGSTKCRYTPVKPRYVQIFRCTVFVVFSLTNKTNMFHFSEPEKEKVKQYSPFCQLKMLPMLRCKLKQFSPLFLKLVVLRKGQDIARRQVCRVR